MRTNTLMLATAAAMFLAAGASQAQEKVTIGISYQNLAFPYVAALQKAAQNACKALNVTCVEADAVNDTNKELNNVESMMAKGINSASRSRLPASRHRSPRSKLLTKREFRLFSSTARRAVATM